MKFLRRIAQMLIHQWRAHRVRNALQLIIAVAVNAPIALYWRSQHLPFFGTAALVILSGEVLFALISGILL